jgi:hypothetical protein
MIEKMKKKTYSNSITDSKNKYSKKRINNISNRIRSLEKDINKIKNKESFKNLVNKKQIENTFSLNNAKIDNTMTTSEIKLYKENNDPNTSQKNFIKNFLFYDNNRLKVKYNSNNNSFSKKKLSKSKKEISKSEIYKKISNYNSLIHEKKNILLNMHTTNKRRNTKDNIKESSKISLSKIVEPNKKFYKNSLYNIKIHPSFNNCSKVNKYFSVDEIILTDNDSKNESIDNKNIKSFNSNSNIKDMGKLEYEFEIRHLKKRRNMLKKTNKEFEEKIDKMKKRNDIIENKIAEDQKYEKIINNLVVLFKKYILQNKQNGFNSIDSSSNRSKNDEFSFKNIILNIMDIKFEYENNILFNKFKEGIDELLDNNLITNESLYDANIYDKVNSLINIKNNLDNTNTEYKYIFEQNNKYLIYINNLLNGLDIPNFEELEVFIKDIFLNNIKENERMKQIKSALINDTSPNLIEKNNSKFQNINQYINSVNHNNNMNRNKNNIENNYYKLKKMLIDKNNKQKNQNKINYYRHNKRIDAFPHKIFNRTEKNVNLQNSINQTLNINNCLNKNNIYSINNSNSNNYNRNIFYNSLFYRNYNRNLPLYTFKNMKYKMNLENNKSNDMRNSFKRPYYYSNMNNKINQKKIINDEDINFFIDNSEKKNHYINNHKSIAHAKTHSAYNIKKIIK